MESLLYSIAGLPVHPLVVHFAIVILPIASLGLIALIYIPSLRKRYAFITTVGIVLGFLAAFIAKQSGEALSEKTYLPEDHSNYGSLLVYAALALALLTVIWYRTYKNASSSTRLRKRGAALNHLIALISIGVIALTFLAGHSGAESVWKGRLPEPTTEVAVQKVAPASCDIDEVISAFNDQVKGSKFVPTDWQPSEGTDLFDIYENGGIACTYGIQVAEVGGTVMWAPVDQEFWDKKKTQWLSQGQIEIDIPDIDEVDAVVLKEGSTSADEMHVWAINLYIDGLWIQVGASFLQTIEEAVPIIAASVNFKN